MPTGRIAAIGLSCLDTSLARDGTDEGGNVNVVGAEHNGASVAFGTRNSSVAGSPLVDSDVDVTVTC
jgi:hypothetical protein